MNRTKVYIFLSTVVGMAMVLCDPPFDWVDHYRKSIPMVRHGKGTYWANTWPALVAVAVLMVVVLNLDNIFRAIDRYRLRNVKRIPPKHTDEK
jgi:hypothetical protein